MIRNIKNKYMKNSTFKKKKKISSMESMLCDDTCYTFDMQLLGAIDDKNTQCHS